jgi:hypothetical protein
MKHLLEYNSFHKRGTNPNDILGWGDQIKSVAQKNFVGKVFKGYKVEEVEIKNPESFSFADDQGSGIIQLFCQKESPSELDQLISDLSTVGLASEKVQEIKYNINANSFDSKIYYDDEDMYEITAQISPYGSPSQRKENNFLGISYKKYYDDSFDPSYGVGGIITDLIKSQIS